MSGNIDITARLRHRLVKVAVPGDPFMSGYENDPDALEAAEEIERLRSALEVQKNVSGMLRAQLRMFGQIPCVVENEEVGKAEYKMRAAARGN